MADIKIEKKDGGKGGEKPESRRKKNNWWVWAVVVIIVIIVAWIALSDRNDVNETSPEPVVSSEQIIPETPTLFAMTAKQ